MAVVASNKNKVMKNEQVLLEDDDDFEEFPTEGTGSVSHYNVRKCRHPRLDGG